MIDRFRSGSGGLWLTLAWPAGLRGTAGPGPVGGVVRHGIAYAGPGEASVCARHDCGGVVPVSWCPEHGDAVGPVLEWHPGGGIRCTDDEKADVLREGIEDYLGEVDAEDLDADDLAWTLVNAWLRRFQTRAHVDGSRHHSWSGECRDIGEK
ncbi:hypothetical protein K7B06_00045 [Streptomyces erythrochromogenes]|nr:hypothetical protein [Streptomyces erythrochromogenes]